jgi:methenyltetrahydrofolate cyclohydrolase
MLVDRSVRELLDAVSAPDPTPGGGSASALASALGASLLLMVAGLPKTKSGSDEERAALAAASAVLGALRDLLTAAVDEDTAAYDAVVAAYKRQKATSEEQQARKAAIQDAMRGATEVPLRVMRLSSQALEQGAIVARHGYAPASSDVGVGLALLIAGLKGARLNVDVNLASIADAAYVAAVRAEIEKLYGR